MNAEILSIGSELMAGRIADTNAAYLSDRLTLLGFCVTRHTAVGDRREEIRAVLGEAAERAGIAIVTGGLGPTRDDPTREVFARFCGVDLVEDAEAAQNILRIFAARKIPAPASNFGQACIPRGAEVIRNPTGTAAGFAVSHGRRRFFCLPGVPSEMKAMFAQTVEPALRSMSNRATIIRSLHTFGMAESIIGERLYELMAEEHNPEVATQAHEGVITVRVTARDADEAAARRRLDDAEKEIRSRLGSAVFGCDGQTLAEVAASRLERQALTLAIAESCTGGEIAARLTDVPGISRFLLEGVVAYSNESKIRRLGVPAEVIAEHGAVSRRAAEAMAAGMRATSGADIALSITGIAGPSGGTPTKPVGLAYMAIADSSGTHVEKAHLVGNRQQVKDRAAKRALNMLRLYLERREGENG